MHKFFKTKLIMTLMTALILTACASSQKDETAGNVSATKADDHAADGCKRIAYVGNTHNYQDDSSLGNLFERADSMMYERKKELKEMGAKTRG